MSQPVFGGYPHYVASKGGSVAMTQEIAKELKRFGIMVNSVAPGGMMRNIVSYQPAMEEYPGQVKNLNKDCIFGRIRLENSKPKFGNNRNIRHIIEKSVYRGSC